jgi:nitroreductase
MIIAVAARFNPNHKVPEIEQILAVGAAVENMILAARALGFGATIEEGNDPVGWVEPQRLFDDPVVSSLPGLPHRPGRPHAPCHRRRQPRHNRP